MTADGLRRAVVTGASRGIGAAIAQRLATDRYEVIGLSRTTRSDADFEQVECDLLDPDAVSDAMARIGPVSVLVNNAGAAMSNRVERTSVADWDRIMDLNARAPFLCSRAVLKHMRAVGYGRIVTIASTAGLEGAPYIAAYAASKHAVLGFTRALAAELDGTGVTAGAICPTYVATEMTEATVETIIAATNCTEAEARDRIRSMTPGGRILTPDEVARATMKQIDGDSNGAIVVLDGDER